MRRLLPFLRQAFLYGIIGACSSGLDAALFALLSGPLGWDPYVTNVLTVHCGIFCSFLLNRRFNFKMTDRTLRRFLMFYVTGLLGLLLSQFILWAGSFLCCDMTSDLSVYERNAKLLVTALREMGYHVAEPDGAFYLFPRTLEPDDLAFSERAKEFDLLLVPGAGFGAPGHVRLAYCVQTEMIERSLPRFKALADSYRK